MGIPHGVCWLLCVQDGPTVSHVIQSYFDTYITYLLRCGSGQRLACVAWLYSFGFARGCRGQLWHDKDESRNYATWYALAKLGVT